MKYVTINKANAAIAAYGENANRYVGVLIVDWRYRWRRVSWHEVTGTLTCQCSWQPASSHHQLVVPAEGVFQVFHQMELMWRTAS